MAMDDDDDVPPLLPPEDRLWRHPSEVGQALRAVGRRGTGRTIGLLGVTALASSISVLLTLGLVAAIRPWRDDVRSSTPTTDGATLASVTPTGGAGTVSDVAALAERLRPSVARVEADTPTGIRRGSAVVWRQDGLLMTAAHVVDGATTVKVVLHDGRRLAAGVKGTDTDTDIAVLDVDGDDFTAAAIGTVSSLKVGQPAIVIGSPTGGGGGPVVSVGVVGAMGQHVEANGMRLTNLIQTTPLAPGCAGAAVVDVQGKLIGIATANAEADGGVVGYATPIDVAKEVASELATAGRVSRVWLGIDAQDRTDGGAAVTAVYDGSPAAVAGVQVGDVVVEIEGRAITSMGSLLATLRARKPGAMVSLTLEREGQRRTVPVTLAQRPTKAGK